MLQLRQFVRLGSSQRGSRATSKRLSRYFSQYSTSREDDSTPLFDKVLVANRGEIACRVLRTCKSLGIPTVALYSIADGPNALHAQMADEAYLIGHGSAPSESYLLQDEVLEIATRSGARAIHPGYGFLSENAEFCAKVNTQTNGDITFVGPPPSAITAMGSKSKSKAIMEAAGVTTAPGFYGDSEEEQDPLYLLEKATEVGFPLLIKAVMGGGGKGMRLVWSESEFLENLESCKRESVNAFGDSKVLLERYLVKPRHVEVQVVADHHGNVVSLHERDCSLQRRHQKIIEEAPASDLSTALRKNLGEMGCKAAQAVGYVNAGTVEFLLESSHESSREEPNFYFCEMNTRLQVEHPITELITGIDLVEWQLLVAAGEELPIVNSSEIPCRGHSFEARIYAEKPGTGKFLPASGTVWHHDPPAPPNAVGVDAESLKMSNGVRVDTGIQTGQAVGVDYDPMICKLIVHDKTSREKALQKLVKALQDYKIAGVPTNIDFLIRCANHETFQKIGATNTGFLDDHLEEVLPSVDEKPPPKAVALASLATLLVTEKRVNVVNLQESRKQQSSPWNSLSGSWRTFGSPSQTLKLEDGTIVDCKSLRDGSYEITVTGAPSEEEPSTPTSFHVSGSITSDNKMSVVINESERLSLDVALREDGDGFKVCLWPQSISLRNEGYHFLEVTVPNPKSVAKQDSNSSSRSSSGTISAPMPGKVSKILCNVGDSVSKGDVVVVMEAMKMEHTVQAPTSGIIDSISAKVGEVVAEQSTLAVIVAKEQVDSDSDEEPSKEAV